MRNIEYMKMEVIKNFYLITDLIYQYDLAKDDQLGVKLKYYFDKFDKTNPLFREESYFICVCIT